MLEHNDALSHSELVGKVGDGLERPFEQQNQSK